MRLAAWFGVLIAAVFVVVWWRTETPRYQITRGPQGDAILRLDTHDGEIRAFVIARDSDRASLAEKNLHFLEIARYTRDGQPADAR